MSISSDFAIEWGARELRGIGPIMKLGNLSMLPSEVSSAAWRVPHIRICRGLLECTREYAEGNHVCSVEMMLVLHKCASATAYALKKYVEEPLMLKRAQHMVAVMQREIAAAHDHPSRTCMRAFRRAVDSLLVSLQDNQNFLVV